MLSHLIDLANNLVESSKGSATLLHANLGTLVTELDLLAANDFAPSVRGTFLNERTEIRRLSQIDGKQAVFTDKDLRLLKGALERLIPALEQYGGPGNGGSTRSFAFVSDPKLQDIVSRDYAELERKLLPSKAWKSSVIMAGSILEALLYDKITCDAATKSAAMAHSSAPKYPHSAGPALASTPKDPSTEQWKLDDLIKVAAGIHILPADRSKAIDQVLRDYRNFVHPRVEIRTGHPCTEAEATMAKGALDAVCNYFTP